MRIQKVGEKDLKSSGVFGLIYGETGAGKTTTALSSMPGNSLFINCEPRDQKVRIKEAGAIGKVDYVNYTNFDELRDFLSSEIDKPSYTSYLLDGVSYLMSINLKGEVLDQIHGTSAKSKASSKQLIAETKMTMEGWGAMAENMIRIAQLCGKLSQQGTCVLWTALVQGDTRFGDGQFGKAPNFAGKAFNKDFPGLFDLIGLVKDNYDKDGKLIYPPKVGFHSSAGDFMAKWTGQGMERVFDLDIDSIMKVRAGK